LIGHIKCVSAGPRGLDSWIGLVLACQCQIKKLKVYESMQCVSTVWVEKK